LGSHDGKDSKTELKRENNKKTNNKQINKQTKITARGAGAKERGNGALSVPSRSGIGWAMKQAIILSSKV